MALPVVYTDFSALYLELMASFNALREEVNKEPIKRKKDRQRNEV